MKLTLSAFFLLLLVGYCSAQKSILAEPYLLNAPSLVSVLANPEKYDGKRIRVTGFLHFQFEDSALYLSKEDGDYLNTENAIWVRYDPNARRAWRCAQTQPTNLANDYFHGKYVTLIGTFNMKERGHMGGFSGTIENVTSIIEGRRWYDGTARVVKMDKESRIKDKCQ